MNGVFIIPTGIGCKIGGHAGDATPVAKLIASCCNKLIIHPNVVNASDINEMTENMLYVEGSQLDRFLQGRINLVESNGNKILVAVNKPAKNETINAVSAARATIGIDAQIIELETELTMTAYMENGIATGHVSGWQELIMQISEYDFDALAIHSVIDVNRDVALNYYRDGGVNPWGGVEAKASKLIADRIDKPVAHSPIENTSRDDKELYFIFDEIVNPAIAAEAVSICYLHCVLKGLYKAPRLLLLQKNRGMSFRDVNFLITPHGCFGHPHRACLKNNIPIIVVKDNTTCLNELIPEAIYVKNYLEACGVVKALETGITIESLQRPLENTLIKKINLRKSNGK